MSDQINIIKHHLKTVMKTHNLSDFTCTLAGSCENGSGYLSDIIFTKLTSMNGNQKSYDLVLKCGRQSGQIQNLVAVSELFANEIFAYTDLIPTLQQFQVQKQSNHSDIFNSIPKCYGTFMDRTDKYIVLDDLTAGGYKLWDRTVPMNLAHIKMVLKEYGKLHGISMAMNHQKPALFQKFASSVRNCLQKFVYGVFDNIQGYFSDACQVFADNKLVYDKLMSIKNNMHDILEDVYNPSIGQKVTFCHGDCWNNNFMFKYHQNDLSTETPSALAIIDWQMVYTLTPVADISEFLYGCIGKEQLEHFDKLIAAYYDSFAKTVRQLGSDPDRIYSFDELMSDFKAHAKYGLIILATILNMCLCSKDDCPDISKSAENGADIRQAFSFKVGDQSAFNARFEAVVMHFIERDFM